MDTKDALILALTEEIIQLRATNNDWHKKAEGFFPRCRFYAKKVWEIFTIDHRSSVVMSILSIHFYSKFDTELRLPSDEPYGRQVARISGKRHLPTAETVDIVIDILVPRPSVLMDKLTQVSVKLTQEQMTMEHHKEQECVKRFSIEFPRDYKPNVWSEFVRFVDFLNETRPDITIHKTDNELNVDFNRN